MYISYKSVNDRFLLFVQTLNIFMCCMKGLRDSTNSSIKDYNLQTSIIVLCTFNDRRSA